MQKNLIQLKGHLTIGESSLGGARFAAYIPKNITHGEAVLAGMILATKLSIIKKVCNKKVLKDLMEIYSANNLDYTLNKYRYPREINKLIPYLKNDKKNNDEKINFILLNKIGKTTMPNKYKISINELKKNIRSFIQY